MKVLKKKTLKKKEIELKGIKLHSTNPRKYVLIEFDFIENLELFDRDLVEFVEKFRDVKDAIVKVEITIDFENYYRLDLDYIKDLLKDAYYVYEIVPKIIKEKVVRIPSLTPELSPLEAAKVFIRQKNPKRSTEILAKSEQIIREVEI